MTQSQKAPFALEGDSKQAIGHITPQLSIKMLIHVFYLSQNSIVRYEQTKQAYNELENIQPDYLKNMLGKRKQTLSLVVYGDTGKLINYWSKIINLSDNKIL